jgi:hypothetical protein
MEPSASPGRLGSRLTPILTPVYQAEMDVKMNKFVKISLFFIILIGSSLLSACLGVEASPPTPAADTALPAETASPPYTLAPTSDTTPQTQVQDTSAVMATPYADSPAAGICTEVSSEAVVSVEIFPDIPSPRCLKVTAEQKLEVINRTDSTLQLSLGALEQSLSPSETYAMKLPFGEYLMTGVHVLGANPFSGPEIWLQEK